MQRRHLTVAALSLLALPRVHAQPAPRVQLAGLMGGRRALLIIDGQPQMLAIGAEARGVRLVSIDGDLAVIDSAGGRVSLRVGGSPVALGARPADSGGNGVQEIVLTAGPGGHFITGGAINGQAVSFMVDTGATLVSLSQAEATRIGVDLRNGQRGMSNTANGTVPVVAVTLNTVRVGEVEISNVRAVVMPAQMEHVLLGNSFLSRFQMRRDNDIMRLEYRR
jgi:aspartyl protease family protein